MAAAANPSRSAASSRVNTMGSNSSGSKSADESLRALGARFDGDVGGFDVIRLDEEDVPTAASTPGTSLPFFDCIPTWARLDDADADYE